MFRAGRVVVRAVRSRGPALGRRGGPAPGSGCSVPVRFWFGSSLLLVRFQSASGLVTFASGSVPVCFWFGSSLLWVRLQLLTVFGAGGSFISYLCSWVSRFPLPMVVSIEWLISLGSRPDETGTVALRAMLRSIMGISVCWKGSGVSAFFCASALLV